jgi:hypothetical protein
MMGGKTTMRRMGETKAMADDEYAGVGVERSRGEESRQTEERIGAPELTDSHGVGCAMRPRPAKDEDVRDEEPEQV